MRARTHSWSGLSTVAVGLAALLLVGARAAPGQQSRHGHGPPPRSCALSPRGAVTVTQDRVVIEHLRIDVAQGPAIRVHWADDVVIRNCEIRHGSGPGIELRHAANVRIEGCRIVHTGAPERGPNPDHHRNGIDAYRAPDLVVEAVELVRGSSGVYLLESPRARVSRVAGRDFRGPFPRGQLLQADKSDDLLLEDFSVVSEAGTSWPEDNISVFNSSNAVIRRGLIDGNDSPSGVGLMFEQIDGARRGGLVEDVDAVRMGNGAFSAYPGRDITFRRTRMRENIGADQGRGLPLSGGLAWAAEPNRSSGLRIEDSRYFDAYRPQLVWDRRVFTAIELTEEDFTPRAPIELTFCWEGADPSAGCPGPPTAGRRGRPWRSPARTRGWVARSRR